jgi:peptidoglycan/xylan/chitin deacetylase (PgdA/CDA1 family)
MACRRAPCASTPSTSPHCVPLSRGMLTITLDDGYASQATLAAPLLAAYGYQATAYYITYPLDAYGLLPYAQAMAAAGHEVGDHTSTHPDLVTLTTPGIDDELRLSQAYLLANVGAPVTSFASPMGSYDATVISVAQRYFTSHRTANPGMNYVGTSVWELGADGVYNTSTSSEVCAQITDAATRRGWRILVFHDFTTEATSSASLLYPVADFEAILRCAQGTPGLDIVTTRQGVAAIACASR